MELNFCRWSLKFMCIVNDVRFARVSIVNVYMCVRIYIYICRHNVRRNIKNQPVAKSFTYMTSVQPGHISMEVLIENIPNSLPGDFIPHSGPKGWAQQSTLNMVECHTPETKSTLSSSGMLCVLCGPQQLSRISRSWLSLSLSLGVEDHQRIFLKTGIIIFAHLFEIQKSNFNFDFF